MYYKTITDRVKKLLEVYSEDKKPSVAAKTSFKNIGTGYVYSVYEKLSEEEKEKYKVGYEKLTQ